MAGQQVQQQALANGLGSDYIAAAMPQTAQSVILYDKQGQRQIHSDLKDVQERRCIPSTCSSRLCQKVTWPFWATLITHGRSWPYGWRAGIPIATDMHTIATLDDAYNRDYMAAATILFMSDERLPVPPEQWANWLQNEFGTEIVVIGLGAQGALLAVKAHNFCERLPAVYTRPVVNTVGAGDALFAAFTHFYRTSHDPYQALSKAILFASYKVGSSGAAVGFLSEAEFAVWAGKTG